MPRTHLTATVVERMKPPKKGRLEYADNVLPGLSLRVTENGSKSWSLHYRVAGEGGETEGGRQLKGKLKRMTLGRYPLVDLTQAREKARTALELADAGVDPVHARRHDITARREAKANTVGAVAAAFIERYRKRRNKPQTWREGKSVLDRLVLPHWSGRPIADIHRRDVIDLLDYILDHHRPHAANKALKEIRKLFNWAVERELVEASPAVHVNLPTKEHHRDRVLTEDEIVAVWQACAHLGFPFGALIRMLLVTGQRRNEVAHMRWSDLDLENRAWTVPREVTKSDRAHQMPLSTLAVEVLESLPRFNGHYVFSTTSGEKPVSGFSRAKRRVDALSGANNWRLHDLRRTAASGMAKLGTPINVLSKVLNHVSAAGQGGVTAIYNRYGYEAEKRQALEAWSRHLSDLVKREVHDHVVGPTTELQS